MRTMTVADLIQLLSEQDPEAKVIFESDYGDYSHTRQALPLKGELESVIIHGSAYSNSGFAIATVEDEEDSTEEYLVIR